MATQSSILAWRIPQTEEPGGLQSMGLQELDTTQRLNHHHQHTGQGRHSPLPSLKCVFRLQLASVGPGMSHALSPSSSRAVSSDHTLPLVLFVLQVWSCLADSVLGTPSSTPEQGSQAAWLCLCSHECSSGLQDNFLFRDLPSRQTQRLGDKCCLCLVHMVFQQPSKQGVLPRASLMST